MSTENTQNSRRAVNRRTVTTGLAWSVPAVAATAAAPFAAASPFVKVPGINGWVNNSALNHGGCDRSLTVNSNLSGTGDDGAPFGLYLYDTDPQGKYDAAKLVYWVRGDHYNQNPITWSAGGSHSSCWQGPTVGAPQRKADGNQYTPYTWTYTCEINPQNVSRDGRLRLGHFNVESNEFSQSDARGNCLPLDIYTYREIRVDADGDGSQHEPELQYFERKASLRPRSPWPWNAKDGADAAQSTDAEGSEKAEGSVAEAAS